MNGLDSLLQYSGVDRSAINSQRKAQQSHDTQCISLGLSKQAMAGLDALMLANGIKRIKRYSMPFGSQSAIQKRKPFIEIGGVFNLLEVQPMTWTEIVYCLGGDKARMKALLRSLEAQGYVELCDVKRDHKRFKIITRQGYKLSADNKRIEGSYCV